MSANFAGPEVKKSFLWRLEILNRLVDLCDERVERKDLCWNGAHLGLGLHGVLSEAKAFMGVLER